MLGAVVLMALAAVALAAAPSASERRSDPPRWALGERIPVWIEDVQVPADHLEMVRRALRTWSRAAGGSLAFEEAKDYPPAGIRIRFVTGDVNFGEAMPSMDRHTGAIVRADVVLSVDVPGDPLQKQLVLYLTALHEIGHAIGLGHSDNFSSIMYRFRRPLDPDRYFLRYRKSLRSADDIGADRATGLFPDDLAALQRLYAR